MFIVLQLSVTVCLISVMCVEHIHIVIGLEKEGPLLVSYGALRYYHIFSEKECGSNYYFFEMFLTLHTSSLPGSRNPSKGINPAFSKSMENLLDFTPKTVDIPDICMWEKFLLNFPSKCKPFSKESVLLILIPE